MVWELTIHIKLIAHVDSLPLPDSVPMVGS
jgi:hypothetical protein